MYEWGRGACIGGIHVTGEKEECDILTSSLNKQDMIINRK
jgi:hypothetical protein